MSWLARCLGSAGVLVVLVAPACPAAAAPPAIQGRIEGLELAPRAGHHGAIFLIVFQGTLDQRRADGWGWIEVFHGDLPDVGKTSSVDGGHGVLWIGLGQFTVDVLPDPEGLLGGGSDTTNPVDGLFGIRAPLFVCNRRGECGPHIFQGTLSHLAFPPTIEGAVSPSP